MTSKIIFLLLSSFGLSACAQVHFHQNYFSLDLPVEKFEAARSSLETSQNLKLKTRGEAHLTLITPPEWTQLENFIQVSEVLAWSRSLGLGAKDLHPICIGKGMMPPDRATFFVVVESTRWLELRHRIEQIARQRGLKDEKFEASHFYPHVTVGFTDRDLHEQDGVIKSTQSCIQKWMGR